MAERPAKRPRNSTGNSDDEVPVYVAHPTEAEFQHATDLVNSIDANAAASMLANAASHFPKVFENIEKYIERRDAKEWTKIVDFDYLSKDAWKAFNVTYARMKDSQAYMMTGKVSATIDDCYSIIQQQCPKHASFGTKKNALETLRKIAKSICLSTGIIPREIRNDGGGELMEVMATIVSSLTDEQRGQLKPWCDDKLSELQKMAHESCIFEDVSEIIDLIHDDGDEDEVEDEVEDEDSDEESGNSET